MTKHEQQLQREIDMLQKGQELYKRAMESKDATDLVPGQTLLNRALVPMVDAIEAMIERVEQGKAGRGRPALSVTYLRHLQPAAVAYIACRTILNAAGQADNRTKTAMTISNRIEEAYRTDELMAEAPGLGHYMGRKAAAWSTSFHRRAIMRTGADIANVSGLDWEPKAKLNLGMKLIELFVECTGLIMIRTLKRGTTNASVILDYTPETRDWLMSQHSRLELMDPKYQPMIVKPRPWTNPIDGGYLTSEVSRTVGLVSNASRGARDELFNQDLTAVYKAINAVQETAWQINPAVYNVLDVLWEQGGGVAGLPPCEPLPLPERPSCMDSGIAFEDFTEEQKEVHGVWKREAAAVHGENASLMSKRISTSSKMGIAKSLLEEEEIYFPHHLDFRGRIYPTASGLSPQGDDVAKGLLRFAVGKPLGENGAAWLLIHAANLFGVDKVSLEDRIAWAEENMASLIDSGLNPLDGERFWLEADSPFCALAVCAEIAGWSIQGDSYISHLPIAMDGTCSGLQHFSAMLADEIGGKAVNLVPADKPADIYTAVANHVEGQLLALTDLEALAWRGNVTRKIVKRPAMTFAYSVTNRGMRDQILSELNKMGSEAFPGHDNFAMASYLTPLVMEAIRSTVVKAAEAMDWLKNTVKPAVADGPVAWHTPDGFLVQQRYVKTQGKRFSLWYNGENIKVQLRVEGVTQDRRRHSNAVAPNFVHSMDAAHLRMVVKELSEEGMTEFAMIHDSFGTHAATLDLMNEKIRSVFVKMYSEDVLGTFLEEIKAQASDEDMAELSTPPAKGNLDLNQIINSDFFFS